MFKKTPIALAVLALSASFCTAYANNSNNEPMVGQFVAPSGQVEQPNESLASTYEHIVQTGNAVNNNSTKVEFWSNFDSLHFETKDTAKDKHAVVAKSGVLGIGLNFNKETFGSIDNDAYAEAVPDLTIKSMTGAGIFSSLSAGNDNSHIYIAAQNTTISTKSTTRAAIVLRGSDNPNANEDDEHPSLTFLRYDKSQITSLDNEHLKFWKDVGPNYGVFTEDEIAAKHGQSLTIESPAIAIELKRRASMDVHAGDVSILGNVQILDGSSLQMGYNVAPQEKIPTYLRDYIGTADDSNEYRINSVSIEAKKSDVAAVEIRDGSQFSVSANDIYISGVQKKENNKNQYSTAILLDTSASKFYAENGEGVIGQYHMPAVLSLHAKDSLVINGDIVLEHDNTEQDAIALVDIRCDGETLNINGKIRVESPNGKSGNTVKMTIKGKGQKFTGDIIDEINAIFPEPESQVAVYSMRRLQPEVVLTPGTFIDLVDDGELALTDDSQITSINVSSSKSRTVKPAAVIDAGTSNVKIAQLEVGHDLHLKASGINEGQFKIENNNVTTGAIGLTISNVQGQQSQETLKSIFNVENGSKALELEVTEGNGTTSHKLSLDKYGEVTNFEVEDNTSVAKSINDVAGLSVLAWRAQMNDVNKRLGDLRTYQGNHGGWARVYGSESEFGDLGLKSKSHTVQVGADTKLGNNFYFGATASYSDGKGTLNNGSTDDRSYSFGVYGGWMGNDGQFVDVIVKRANFKTDFDLRYTTNEQSTGSFDLWGTSVCAEYGWRFPVTENVWVEPQAEITYGYMNDVTYTYSGVKATQEATESLVGRLGVALGTTFKSGSAYVKASVAHDWMGETEISMSNGNAAMKEDLGGTWGEFAVGGTYNFGNGWAVYGEFQTAHGSKMKTPWQYNLGARYVF